MKVAFSTKIRYLAGTLTFLFLVGGAALYMMSLLHVQHLEGLIAAQAKGPAPQALAKPLAELLALAEQVNLLASLLAATGFVLALVMLVSSVRTGLTKYRRIVDRIALDRPGIFSLKSVKFPDEDEYGNLGKKLNQLVNALDRFDRLKTDRLAAAHYKLRVMHELIVDPVAIFTSELRLATANKAFLETFAVREGRENLKATALVKGDGFEEALSGLFFKGTESTLHGVEVETEGGSWTCDVALVPVRAVGQETLEVAPSADRASVQYIIERVVQSGDETYEAIVHFTNVRPLSGPREKPAGKKR